MLQMNNLVRAVPGQLLVVRVVDVNLATNRFATIADIGVLTGLGAMAFDGTTFEALLATLLGRLSLEVEVTGMAFGGIVFFYVR